MNKPLARTDEYQDRLPGVPEAPSMLAIIERAARDPVVDVQKMKELMEMARQVRADEAKAAYYTDLSDMQDNLPSITERGEIKIKEDKPGQKYALWEDINKAIKPILKQYGFALSFRCGQSEAKITVTGILSHRQGHSEETTIFLPSDTSGSKNAVQAVGSSISYGKRYTASALLNLTSGGEDDDGVKGGMAGIVNDDQVEKIFDLIKATKSDTKLFCEHFGIASVPDLPTARFADAMTMLNTKAKKLQAAQ